MPEERGFTVAAGLGDVLDYIENWRFTDRDLDYLAGQSLFEADFLRRLKDVSFTGDVDAVPEGTLVFEDEPLVRVSGPVLEAQLLETLILNQVHVQTVLASKAARVRLAAGDRAVVDFGSRRAHGADAALKAARAGHIAGLDGTSNVLAGQAYGVPIFGTMAHSYIQAHDDELDAFDAFSRLYPHTTLLVDTYDTLAGVDLVIELSRRQGTEFSVRALRLDSGDLAELAQESRRRLDAAGLTEVKLFASGGLDEYKITDLIAAGAPINGFGVGTKMVISKDVPDLDVAYKLVAYDGKPRMKLSSGKRIHPGPKQVFREEDENGRMVRDVLARIDEDRPGRPLLVPVMKNGRRIESDAWNLDAARRRCRDQMGRLPSGLLELTPRASYPVVVSDRLESETRALEAELIRKQSAAPHGD
jgi:nicotinate phosphoribosyltransferase